MDSHSVVRKRVKSSVLSFSISRWFAVLLLFFLIESSGAQWTASGPGPFGYDDVANWQSGTINDQITNNPGADQTIDFISDRMMPKGLLIKQPLASSERHYNLIFRARDVDDSIGSPRTLTLGGPIVVDLGGTNDATTLFGDDASLNLDFNNVQAVFEILTGNSELEIKGSILNARGLIAKGTGGRILLSGGVLNVTGQVSLEGVRLGLTGEAALPEIKALLLAGRSTLSLQNDRPNVIDRFPDDAPISCAGTTEIHLATLGQSSSEEVIGKVFLNEGCLELSAVAREGGGSTLTLSELVRKSGTILIVGYESSEASSRVKLINDKLVLDVLVGGGGAEGSTTASIIPWVRGHGAGDFYSAAGFHTYSQDEGFRELKKEREYAQDMTASKPVDNLRIASGEITLSESKTLNSLFSIRRRTWRARPALIWAAIHSP